MLFLISQYAIQCQLLVKITDRCWMLMVITILIKWSLVGSLDTCESMRESIRTLRELIDVRDGYSECIGFTNDEIGEFILALCSG